MSLTALPRTVHTLMENRQSQIATRLRVPCTASEIAALFGITPHLARACLYQLQRQHRAVRLDKRVPKCNRSGRQWEYLWSAA